MEIQNVSYYINPNTNTLTTNPANAAIFDQEMFSSMQKQLRPVDDMQKVLMTPMKLAGRTYANRRDNSFSLAEGARITLDAGYVLTVKSMGVEVSGGDINNQEARQKAQDMASALATLLRNASGQMQNVADGETSYEKWTAEVDKILLQLGLDTGKDFSINGMKYTRDENGYWVSQMQQQLMDMYEQQKEYNKTYLYADEKTKQQVQYMSSYYLRTLPNVVKNIWQETLDDTGINPFGTGYASSLQQLSAEQDFLTRGNDNIFGDSVETCISGVEKILDRIQNPVGTIGSKNEEMLKQEKEFYTNLLSNLRKIV